MPPRVSSVADYLRAHKNEIIVQWEAEVTANLAPLRQLSRPVLIDHLPELLDGLAASVEGREEEATRAFATLVHGHALLRLGFGIDGETLAIEYSRLRHVVLRHLLEVPSTLEVREDLVRLDAAIDHAVNASMGSYAARRDAMRERFVAILAHDLRTPLGSVLLSAEALQRSPDDDRTADLVRRIIGSGQRMQRMIDSVVDFAQGHLGGGLRIVPVPGDMAAICHATADEYRSANPTPPVRVELEGDLRGNWDADRVHQALANLLGNAGQYGAEAEILLRAWESEDRRTIYTTVTNQGPPIPPELLPKLFDPFARGSAPDRKGLGLGLYIVQQIALTHGARCSVESTDAATTFTIAWPRTPAEEVPVRPSR
jgi:signal transduction histidine kinase